MSVEFKPEWAGKNLADLPDGASGYKAKPAEQVLNEMTDGGVVITEAEDFMRAVPQTFSFPKVCNPLDYLKILDQQQKGACAGFTMAQIASMNFWVATGGKRTQGFSGDAMYLLAQEYDKLVGRDVGSTPTACAWVAQNIGVVPIEAYGPTVKTYNDLKPVTDAHREAAADYKLTSIVRLKTYDQIYQFLGGGLGAVQCCSLWKQHFMESNLVDSFHGEKHASGHGGGHSYTFNGYDENGNILATNSWNTKVHDEGGFLMTPGCIKEMGQNPQTVWLGYSNMATSKAEPPGPRSIPFEASDY